MKKDITRFGSGNLDNIKITKKKEISKSKKQKI